MEVKKCKYGHEMTEQNTYLCTNGSKVCKVCRANTAKKNGQYRGPQPSKRELEILKKVVGV
jgi:hypothetical protein